MNGLNSSEDTNPGLGIRPEPFSDHYSIEGDLGRGKFAVVKKCKHKSSGVHYAAKFLRKRRKGKDCRQEVLHEIHMLELSLQHPRLVDLVEVFESNHDIIIVTEYASGGELHQHVMMEEGLDERHVRRLMRQILDGLHFLHTKNIVHLDVKPQNILLTDRPPDGDIKLCDLGFARVVNSNEDIRDIIGTPDYCAPEVLNYEPIHQASDMWSVGVLAYVMLTGYSPFAGDTKMETFSNITQGVVDFPEDLFGEVSPEAIDFINKLLVLEPEQRMLAHDCLNHRWLRHDAPIYNIITPNSPFGSPLPCRRPLPASPDSTLEDEPMKRKRCADSDDEINHVCSATCPNTNVVENGVSSCDVCTDKSGHTDVVDNGVSSMENGTDDAESGLREPDTGIVTNGVSAQCMVTEAAQSQPTSEVQDEVSNEQMAHGAENSYEVPENPHENGVEISHEIIEYPEENRVQITIENAEKYALDDDVHIENDIRINSTESCSISIDVHIDNEDAHCTIQKDDNCNMDNGDYVINENGIDTEKENSKNGNETQNRINGLNNHTCEVTIKDIANASSNIENSFCDVQNAKNVRIVKESLSKTCQLSNGVIKAATYNITLIKSPEHHLKQSPH